MLLGLYAFDEFKTTHEGKKKNVIEAVTILVENAHELAGRKRRSAESGDHCARGSCCP